MHRILVIDDSAEVFDLVRSFLGPNYEILFAKDAFNASELLDMHRMDLVLLDLNMPMKSGFTFLQEIRRTRRHQFLRVAVLTGRVDKRDILRAGQLGVEAYITKPFKKQEFKERIEQLLSQTPIRESNQIVFEPKSAPTGKIILEVDILITRVTELGLMFQSPVPLSPGKTIKLNSPISAEMGLPGFAVEILSSEPAENGEHTLMASFLRPSYEELNAIREWLKKRSEGGT